MTPDANWAMNRAFDRRTLLRGAVGSVVVGGAAGILAGCGDDEDEDAAGSGQSEAKKPTGTIQFSSWGGEYSDAWKTTIAVPFTKASGVEVEFDDAPAEHVAKLNAQKQAGQVSWDVVEAAFADYFALQEQDLLEPLPQALIDKLAPLSLEGGVAKYGVACSAGSNQVIASLASLERSPATPAEFWDVEAFPGVRGLWRDGALDNVASALFADGVAKDALMPLDLDRAFAKLDEIRPHIDVFWTSGDQLEQILRDGEVDMTLAWDGRAWKVKQGGTDLVIEYDSALVTSNYLTLTKDSDNRDGALTFIDFYASHPKEQAAWTEINLYTTSNKEATSYVKPEVEETLWLNHMNDVVVLDPNTVDVDFKAVQQRWYDWLEG